MNYSREGKLADQRAAVDCPVHLELAQRNNPVSTMPLPKHIRSLESLHATLAEGITTKDVFLKFKSLPYHRQHKQSQDPDSSKECPSCKKKSDKKDLPFDLAADCTAFANTWGGVIVIGAKENGGRHGKDLFDGYEPFSRAQAIEERKWISAQLNSRTHPALTRFEVNPIEREPDQWVVALNIYPSADLICTTPTNNPALHFYRRDTQGNQSMTPDEVMAWSPQERAGKIRFEMALQAAGKTIPADGAIQIDGAISSGVFRAVDGMELMQPISARLTYLPDRAYFSATLHNKHVVQIPYSVIKEAWSTGKKGSSCTYRKGGPLPEGHPSRAVFLGCAITSIASVCQLGQ